jgi:Cu-Zn family superoxide dismutase
MSLRIGRKTAAIMAALVLTTSFVAFRAATAGAGTQTAHALVRNADGAPVGVVTFSDDGDTVLVRAVVHDLAPGFHGFHVHGAGSCVAPAFTSAGGHYNPGAAIHAAHAGDMPSLLVNADGTGVLRFTTDRFTISGLLAGGGTAVIIHGSPDNFNNIPLGTASNQYTANSADATTLSNNTGNAGARVGCGVIS